MTAFVHLHTHSEYSMLMGAARIKALVQKAVSLEQNSLALTDHGNMFGTLEFYTAAKKAGIKPIIGLDAFIAPDNRNNQNYPPHQPVFHKLVLIARDHVGYLNLLQLCSVGHLEGFYQKPRIDLESLQKYGKGLICLVPNYKSQIGTFLLQDRLDECEQQLDDLSSIFSKDNIYLCLQKHGVTQQEEVNSKFLSLHHKDGWKLLADNDVHYVEQSDFEAHDILMCIDGGWKIDDAERPRFPSDQFFFKSNTEMAEMFGEYPGALQNSLDIAESCNVEIEFGTLYHPQCPIPPEFDDDNQYLEHLSWQGLKQRYDEITPELEERLKHELNIMREMKVAGYMLIVQDFIQAAKDMGVPVGPGRGSAVGSLVSYAIGVTDVDPIRFKLLFERFLNPERVSMPDIDTDFSDLDRDKVIQYVVEKYGKDSVAQIVTYGRMKAKMVLRDVGRVMGFEASRLNQICKLFPANNPFADLRTAIKEAPDLKKELESEPGLQKLYTNALKLEGFVRQAGMHAAAVIIAPKSVVNFAPLFRQPGSEHIMIQYDKTFSEDIGLLKMDFLGLRNLSVIQDCLQMVKADSGKDIDPLLLPENDPKTLELLGKGQTVGVFQFESGGMQDYLRKLKPTCLEDMIAMNALYRPGPIKFIPQFIARKHGQEEVDTFHEKLADILNETYGVIVYQEQVMQIAQVLSGFSLGGADLLRRAMAKKNLAKMDELKPKFINGAKDRGFDPKMAERIWDVLVPFSSYAFNKSHSAAYATIAYQTAYLKAHYPAYYMAANLTSEMNDTTRLVVLINDCKQIGLEVTFPDINTSTATFRAREGKIVYGLAGIKNVGKGAVAKIIEEREKNGPFTTLYDLCKRVDLRELNRRALESLIFAGALDRFPGNRAQQFAAVESAIEYAQGFQDDRNSGQTSLFDMGESKTSLDVGDETLPEVEPWPYIEMLQKEKEVLGLYLSGHPLSPYRRELEAFATTTLSPNDLEKLPPNSNVVLGGMINRIKTRISNRDNRTFAFAELEDFHGKIEVTFWSDVFEEVRHQVEIDDMVLIRGKIQVDSERQTKKLVASKVMALSEARSRLTKSIHIKLSTPGLQQHSLDQIHKTCSGFSGGCQFIMHLETKHGQEVTMLGETVPVSPEQEFTDELEKLVGETNVWLSSQKL